MSSAIPSSTGTSKQNAWSQPCLHCGRLFCRDMKMKTGPDGFRTLCVGCHSLYRNMKLTLFESPVGNVSARRIPGSRPVKVIGFDKTVFHERFLSPIVRPLSVHSAVDVVSIASSSSEDEGGGEPANDPTEELRDGSATIADAVAVGEPVRALSFRERFPRKAAPRPLVQRVPESRAGTHISEMAGSTSTPPLSRHANAVRSEDQTERDMTQDAPIKDFATIDTRRAEPGSQSDPFQTAAVINIKDVVLEGLTKAEVLTSRPYTAGVSAVQELNDVGTTPKCSRLAGPGSQSDITQTAADKSIKKEPVLEALGSIELVSAQTYTACAGATQELKGNRSTPKRSRIFNISTVVGGDLPDVVGKGNLSPRVESPKERSVSTGQVEKTSSQGKEENRREPGINTNGDRIGSQPDVAPSTSDACRKQKSAPGGQRDAHLVNAAPHAGKARVAQQLQADAATLKQSRHPSISAAGVEARTAMMPNARLSVRAEAATGSGVSVGRVEKTPSKKKNRKQRGTATNSAQHNENAALNTGNASTVQQMERSMTPPTQCHNPSVSAADAEARTAVVPNPPSLEIADPPKGSGESLGRVEKISSKEKKRNRKRKTTEDKNGEGPSPPDSVPVNADKCQKKEAAPEWRGDVQLAVSGRHTNSQSTAQHPDVRGTTPKKSLNASASAVTTEDRPDVVCKPGLSKSVERLKGSGVSLGRVEKKSSKKKKKKLDRASKNVEFRKESVVNAGPVEKKSSKEKKKKKKKKRTCDTRRTSNTECEQPASHSDVKQATVAGSGKKANLTKGRGDIELIDSGTRSGGASTVQQEGGSETTPGKSRNPRKSTGFTEPQACAARNRGLSVIAEPPGGRNVRLGQAETTPSRLKKRVIHVKVTCGSDHSGAGFSRRFTLEPGLSFSTFRGQLQGMFGIQTTFIVTYKDEEGDDVALTSDNELTELFDIARKYSISPVRISVTVLAT